MTLKEAMLYGNTIIKNRFAKLNVTEGYEEYFGNSNDIVLDEKGRHLTAWNISMSVSYNTAYDFIHWYGHAVSCGFASSTSSKKGEFPYLAIGYSSPDTSSKCYLLYSAQYLGASIKSMLYKSQILHVNAGSRGRMYGEYNSLLDNFTSTSGMSTTPSTVNKSTNYTETIKTILTPELFQEKINDNPSAKPTGVLEIEIDGTYHYIRLVLNTDFGNYLNHRGYGENFDEQEGSDLTGYINYTSAPKFDITDLVGIYNYVVNGEYDKESSYDTNYTVYVDAPSDGINPIYKLIWHTPYAEENLTTDNLQIRIGFHNALSNFSDDGYYKYIPYNDGYFSFNFNDVFSEVGDIDSIPDVVEDLLPRSNVKVSFRVQEVSSGGTSDVESSQPMFIESSYKATEGYTYGFVKTYGFVNLSDGSTITILKGSGEGDDGYEPPDDSDDDVPQGDEDFVTSGALTKTYAMSLSRLRALGSALWDTNFIDNISLVNNSPIENIVSVKAFPFSLSGVETPIKIGNVDVGVNGNVVSSNTVTITLGSVTIPKKYNSFLDFAPYTSVAIHLPYIGFTELDVGKVIGKTIYVKYVVDLICGACKALITTTGSVLFEYEGNIGIDVPITGSNRAQVEMGYITSGVGLVGSIASGNVLGAIGSGLSMAQQKYHYQSSGKPSPNTSSGSGANRKCYVIVSRPMYDESAGFNHAYGRMCNLTKRIGSLSGFTVVNKNAPLDSINCTKEEKEELRNILSNGIYV